VTRAQRPKPAGRRRSRLRAGLAALPWIGPTLVLVFGVVLFPAGYMAWTSTRHLSQYGVDRGPAGLDNYRTVFENDAMPRVLANTVVWVVGVVGLTIVISLALAQLLDKAFPGRRLVRLAVIVPWAASVVMTSVVIYYGLDPYYGVINRALVDLHILDSPYGFTKNTVPAFAVSMATAVFVSLPFTTYTILAGLQAIPGEILEAADVDGASATKRYFQVILPNLRPALTVAVIINVINVFNSLPILRTMTGSIPGYDADTTTTLIFKYIQVDRHVDAAAALSMVNFVIVLVVILLYLRLARPMRES
jgi:multiple sugar transport system permease protein